MGFTYLGPVDGHDLDDLKKQLKLCEEGKWTGTCSCCHEKKEKATSQQKKTQQALGMEQAHIKSKTGKWLKKSGPPSYPSVFANTLKTIAREDERVVAVTPAMPGGSKLDLFAKEFPERMIDVGIAEQHAATMSAGLATQGMKPVFAVYSTFLQRGYDQVVHDICRQNLNVLIAIDRAGLVGADGETHQGVFDISFLRALPNMVILNPRNENELQHMLYTAIKYDDGPIAVRYPRGNGTGVKMDAQLKQLPIGKWEVLNEGTDAVILTFGTMIPVAEKAIENMTAQGYNVRLVNANSVKPLDEDMLRKIAEEELPILTVEEAILQGGFGSAVMEFYNDQVYKRL